MRATPSRVTPRIRGVTTFLQPCPLPSQTSTIVVPQPARDALTNAHRLLQRNMKVLVHVKEKCIPVSVGNGDQPVRWLANVGIARHDDHQGLTLGLPVGVKAEDGSLLNMDSTLVAAKLTDMQHVWVTFKGAPLALRIWCPPQLKPHACLVCLQTTRTTPSS